MKRISQRRGQPLLVLTAVMLGWIGTRAVIWHVDHGVVGIVPPAVAFSAPQALPTSLRGLQSPSSPISGKAGWTEIGAQERVRSEGVGSAFDHRAAQVPPLAPSRRQTPPVAEPGFAATQGPPVRAVAGAMLGTASAGERTPSFVAPFSPPQTPQGQYAARRWSADAWTLLRSGGGAASAGPSIATYGASQIGAVLRYRLWPGNAHRLTSYLRVSAALNGSGEREAALGLSIRPVGALPLFVAAEGRVSHLSGRTVVRPAVMAVTELPPIALPKGARAEFYLQGGYVGGLGATPFIDGQLRLDGRVAHIGLVELRAGGGVWGGAQRGAGRLDLGPGMTVQVAKGAAAMRLALDWRFRLKGEAAPASGPALTISAGF